MIQCARLSAASTFLLNVSASEGVHSTFPVCVRILEDFHVHVRAHVFMWLAVACFLEIRLQCRALCSLLRRQTVIRGVSHPLQGGPLCSHSQQPL